MFSDVPTFDGAKNDWLMSDDGGADLLEEFSVSDVRKSTEASPRVGKSGAEARASTGGSHSVGSNSAMAAAVAANGYTSLLKPGEKVVVEGPVTVSSQMGLVTRRRHLLLCQLQNSLEGGVENTAVAATAAAAAGTARFLYIDPVTVTLKGEIPVEVGQVSVTIRASGKDFDVVAGRKSYRFRDVMGAPGRWKTGLDGVLGKMAKNGGGGGGGRGGGDGASRSSRGAGSG
jgi:hypothetical protein